MPFAGGAQPAPHTQLYRAQTAAPKQTSRSRRILLPALLVCPFTLHRPALVRGLRRGVHRAAALPAARWTRLLPAALLPAARGFWTAPHPPFAPGPAGPPPTRCRRCVYQPLEQLEGACHGLRLADSRAPARPPNRAPARSQRDVLRARAGAAVWGARQRHHRAGGLAAGGIHTAPRPLHWPISIAGRCHIQIGRRCRAATIDPTPQTGHCPVPCAGALQHAGQHLGARLGGGVGRGISGRQRGSWRSLPMRGAHSSAHRDTAEGPGPPCGLTAPKPLRAPFLPPAPPRPAPPCATPPPRGSLPPPRRPALPRSYPNHPTPAAPPRSPRAGPPARPPAASGRHRPRQAGPHAAPRPP